VKIYKTFKRVFRKEKNTKKHRKIKRRRSENKNFKTHFKRLEQLPLKRTKASQQEEATQRRDAISK